MPQVLVAAAARENLVAVELAVEAASREELEAVVAQALL
jgi:hypothetical protein